jgi:hypothetical protein
MAVAYTVKMLIERIRIHMANNFPSDESSLSINQVLLHVSQALSFNMVGQVYAGAKLEGLLDMPEGYLATYSLTLTKDEATRNWYGDLPHPPVSLPIHTAIKEVYFASSAEGQSDSVMLIKGRRVAFRRFMPLPNGNRAWLDGSRIIVASSNGNGFLDKTLYVRMAKSRVTDITEDLNIPDDAIEAIFTSVTKKLSERFNTPQDVVKDDVPAGNKAG